ncbi:MAG TPA: NUDIX hydrolase [Candidatus Levybacteria bacterium]|nr:NUDIX hydrolase [Candidatus Levybacteria bacterium]
MRVNTVGGLLIKNKQVLLVKHGDGAQHLTGVYGLPGGRLEEGESLLDGAAREFYEETGFTAGKHSMVKMPKIYEAEIPRKNGEILSTSWHVFLIKEASGELIKSYETEPEWVDIDNLSKLNLLVNTKEVIEDADILLNNT